MPTPLGAADYYDFFPSGDHHPGDIWVDLPTFGILPEDKLPGLVITPACDLSNRKVETITYVPIVPVSEYLVSRSSLPDIKRAVEGQLEAGGLGDLLSLQTGFAWPMGADIDAALQIISVILSEPKTATKIKSALARAASGLRLLGSLCGDDNHQPNLSDLRTLIGSKAFEEAIRRLITNARMDSYFLPADEQRPAWSGVRVHSVALFRFPLTLPIEVLEMAQRVSESEWKEASGRVRTRLPCIDSIAKRPMKRQRLRARFGSDLLTRYTAMFGRLGSPDFTPDTVTRFTHEIQDAQ